MHTPVLLQETIDALVIKPGRKYIDCTFGSGGHSFEIARLGGDVLALDYDKTAVEKGKAEAKRRNILLVYGNYANIEKIAKVNNYIACAGILFDLGLSMEQLEGDRGFSYKKEDAFLDMRLSEEIDITAYDIVKSYSENELYEALVKGAEELNSWAIVQSIVRARRINPIKTVGDLNRIVKNGTSLSGQRLEKVLRKVYQALFICVNNEFENLKNGLNGAFKCLGSREIIAVISFHSGQERIIKRFAKDKRLKMKIIRKKGDEARKFERSATLRILKKI